MLYALLALALAAPPPMKTAQFPNIADKQLLFTAAPIEKDGAWWRFCLTGRKPKGDLFLFHVLVERGGETFRVDGPRLTRADEENIEVCAEQDSKDPKEPRLRKGEVLKLVAVGATRGPVSLTLTVEEVRR